MAAEKETAGKRRPRDGDLEPLLELIWEGASLSKACRTLGMHIPSTDTWIHDDDGRREQYARACEGRSDYLQEDALVLNRAAALGMTVELPGEGGTSKVDASGAKGYLEAVKWAAGRMAPKKEPVKRIDLTARTRQMTDAEIEAELAGYGAAAAADED